MSGVWNSRNPSDCSVLTHSDNRRIYGFAFGYAQICSANFTYPIKVMHLIQKSDFVYWMFAKFFQSQLLKLIGTPPEVYKEFTPEEKELAQEMLDVMHPMSPRRRGTVQTFEIRPLDSVSMSEISAPTLILHAKDDKLVNYKHAEFAHRNIKQSKVISFEDGGHGLLAQFKEVRGHVRKFLSENVLR